MRRRRRRRPVRDWSDGFFQDPPTDWREQLLQLLAVLFILALAFIGGI